MSDPNATDLDDEWSEANAAAQELREGIERLRQRVLHERQRLGTETDPEPNAS